MTREEEIKKEAHKITENLHPLVVYANINMFIKGAKWADEHPQSPWVSIKDDLPCNHKELMKTEIYTKKIIVYLNDGRVRGTIMFLGKWNEYGSKITHWKFIELPKE